MSEFDIDKVRKLDGGLLLIFRELVERRNAKEVAARLGLSPSAISHSLSRLRELFEDPLFVRKPHGLEPTARALALQVPVRQLLASAEQLLGARREFEPATTTRLFTVAAPEYFTAQVAAPLVQHFAQHAPSLFVYYQHIPPTDAVAQIRRGEVDFGIGRFEEPLPTGLVREPLYEDSFCVVARRGHPRIRGRLSKSRYAAEGHVLAGALSEVTSEEQRSVPEMPNGVVVGSWITALTIAAETDSLATCHRRLAERMATLLGIQVLAPPFEPYVFEVSLVRRDDPDPGTAWVLEQVRTIVGASVS